MRNIFLMACCLLCAFCSSSQKGDSTVTQEEAYVMPTNPFPSVLEQSFLHELTVYSVEVKPETIDFDCSERNDRKAFWCSFKAEMKHPDDNLPNKVILSFMTSIPEEYVKMYHAKTKLLKKSRSKFYFMMIHRPFLSEFDPPLGKVIHGTYFAIHDDKMCLSWYEDYEGCPGGIQ